ncbi:MFS transporter [Pseudonocardia sp. WMMC193]|uniref:MFS transporter n=1 Tax=Pseudonocardia sp. WMMC193 TaxID=2911965 RepID=UPI001F3D7EF0|nr:MFS transporter [Pseudonocardia sp. WMMC193]MCF7549607.1 MFS transporter [Pseudonocardia sp. WMMC193]
MTAVAPAPVSRAAAVAVLTTTSLAAVLVFGSASALGVAVPDMAADLAGGAGTATWVVLAFPLANAATILVFGKLSDSLGRRPLYLGGLVVFTLCAAVCALAREDTVLIAARVLQGLCAAAAVSNTTAVISDVFPPPRLSLALSLNITAGGAATLLGPVVGGLLVDAYGWRSILWCAVPIGLLACGIGWWSLRHAHSPARSAGFRLDVPGAVLSIAAIVAVLLAGQFVAAGRVVLAALVLGIGVLAGGVFVTVQRRVREPVLDLRILAGDRGFAYGASFCAGLAFGASALLVVLYLQTVRGFSAGASGALVLPMGLALVVASPATGLLGRWVSARVLTTTGAALVGVAMLGLAGLFTGRPAVVALVVLLTVSGFGEGVFMASITRRVIEGVPADRRAIANGFRSVLHNGALALSTACVLAVVLGGGPDGYVVSAAALGVVGLLAALLSARRDRNG